MNGDYPERSPSTKNESLIAGRPTRRRRARHAALRFLDAHAHVTIVGPVGVGKTFLAHALGHIACSRGASVLAVRTDQMLESLKHAQLDNSYEAELRKVAAVDLPDEWLATFADPVPAQSAIDRFASNAYDLVIEGDSYRPRLKPRLATDAKERSR
jgi:Ni2+-binding GTPase involved in maturation of urease and hydrogenase